MALWAWKTSSFQNHTENNMEMFTENLSKREIWLCDILFNEFLSPNVVLNYTCRKFFALRAKRYSVLYLSEQDSNKNRLLRADCGLGVWRKKVIVISGKKWIKCMWVKNFGSHWESSKCLNNKDWQSGSFFFHRWKTLVV